MELLTAAVLLVAFLTWGMVLSLKGQLSRVERRLNLVLRHLGMDAAPDSPLSDRVKALADDPAHKIEAIKAYREETGAGLAEAKTAVEDYLNGR